MQETLVGEWRDETEKGRKPEKGVLSEAVTTMGTWISIPPGALGYCVD